MGQSSAVHSLSLLLLSQLLCLTVFQTHVSFRGLFIPRCGFTPVLLGMPFLLAGRHPAPGTLRHGTLGIPTGSVLTWGIRWRWDAQPSPEGSAAPRGSAMHAESGFFTAG